jgi:hypothetical protein
MNYLNDKHFLKNLQEQKNIKTRIKIYLLNFDESIKETIEGKTNQCNINLDGNSIIRRTCSLSLSGNKDLGFHSKWWTINNKIRVEIGIVNEIDSTYPPIIWMPLGVYLIDSFTYHENLQNITINITGKDKGAQLNGMAGGTIGHTVILD